MHTRALLPSFYIYENKPSACLVFPVLSCKLPIWHKAAFAPLLDFLDPWSLWPTHQKGLFWWAQTGSGTGVSSPPGEVLAEQSCSGYSRAHGLHGAAQEACMAMTLTRLMLRMLTGPQASWGCLGCSHAQGPCQAAAWDAHTSMVLTLKRPASPSMTSPPQISEHLPNTNQDVSEHFCESTSNFSNWTTKQKT